jgi:hypothetical protein
MQDPNSLSPETLGRIRDLALEEVGVLDELEAAVQADDTQRVMGLARKLIGLEQAVKGV